MSKIYTKTGDAGTTSLVGGKRVPKECARLESYGTIDELNAYVGMNSLLNRLKCHPLSSPSMMLQNSNKASTWLPKDSQSGEASRFLAVVGKLLWLMSVAQFADELNAVSLP